jgi:subtilisin family serine protease
MQEDIMKKTKSLSVILISLSLLFFSANISAFQKKQIKSILDAKQDLSLSRTINQKVQPSPSQISYSSDHILVKFKSSIPDEYVKATMSSFQISEHKVIPRINVFKIKVPEYSSVQDMLYLMKQHQYVEYAEPDYVAYAFVTPNDNFFNYQYALYNSGQYIGPPGSPQGQSSADIKATLAWEITKGTEETLIAVVDSGIDLYHPDLQNKLESSGRDFVNGDFEALDDEGHGTFVAGIIAADTNNNEGIAGVAWNCKLLPVKVLDKTGEGFYSWIIEGIIWAVDNEAAVVNLSLGGPVGTYSLENAVQYAHQNDVVIASAGGNDGGSVVYPAAYDNYCLAVAATDYNDLRVSWSNPGSEIDVAAPGELIISTVPTWYFPPGSVPYGFASGTSFSTAHVSGMAALILSLKPWMTADEVMNVIRYSADDVNGDENPGKDTFIGYGRINMEKALVPIIIETRKNNN